MNDEYNFDGTEVENISLPKVTYDQLIKDQKWLRALEAAGVDNWEGIDFARESLND